MGFDDLTLCLNGLIEGNYYKIFFKLAKYITTTVSITIRILFILVHPLHCKCLFIKRLLPVEKYTTLTIIMLIQMQPFDNNI